MVGIDAKNADNERIDWHWVMSLDLEHGIGAAKSQGIDLIAVLNAADTTFSSTSEKTDPMQDSVLSVQQLHNLLKKDLAVRDRLESIIAQCNTTFMTDFDRLIASYRLPRALAYANRRLCDEIAVLRRIGAAMGLWTIAEERRERVIVPVLQSVAGAESLVNLNDIQDRTAQIVNGRAERRAAEREQKRASDYAMSRANLSGVTSPGGSKVFDYGSLGSAGGSADSAEAAQDRRLADYKKSDWRDATFPAVTSTR